MQLTLDREDLRPEYKRVNCARLRLEHFNSAAQKAIKAVGRATFKEDDGRNYSAIYPKS